jgi:GWxTD domain-containing protein
MQKLILLVTGLTVLYFGTAWSQFNEETRMSGAGNPYFNIEMFRTISDDQKLGRIYIYSTIVNDDLTFLKNDSLQVFEAAFDWEVAVEDADEEEGIDSRSIRKQVIEEDYAETNNREKDILVATSFDLPSGEYVVTVQMNDLKSKKTIARKIEIEMSEFNPENLNMSDILFIDNTQFSPDGDLVNYIPKVKRNFTRQAPTIYVYTEIYSHEYPATIKLRYRLEDKEENIALDTVVVAQVNSALSSHIFELDKHKIEKNRYKFIVDLVQGDERVQRLRDFSFYWTTVPETPTDIDLALRQMRYILETDSLDEYEDAPFPEQQAFFQRFWANRDPNPETESNELMEEYFSRVNFANREFSSFNDDGWLSDRGRILIKFGFPDDVERHPFEMDSIPYVIWRYYGLRKTFVFADRSGFGDYRLLPRYQGQEWN